MSRRKQLNPKPLKVAPPGGPSEGGEELVTLADQKQDSKKSSERRYDEAYDVDEFRPLVIDTNESSGPASKSDAMHKEKELLLKQMSRDIELFRENNPPSDDEQHAPSPSRPSEVAVRSHDLSGGSDGGRSVALGAPVFPTSNPVSEPPVPIPSHPSDSSNSSSRVHSPAVPTTATPGSGGRHGGKLSHPQKARRKTDKILPIDGEKYVCPICQAVLMSNTDLTKHIRSHNNGGPVSANTCTICGKVLSSQSSLDRHMLVHSGERPFKCKFCNMAFTTNGNMHRHTRIHEKEGITAPSSQKSHAPKEPATAPSSSSSSNTSSAYSSKQLRSTGGHNNSEGYSQVGFSNPSLRKMGSTTPTGSKRKLSFDHEEAYLSLSSKRRSFGLNLAREFSLKSPGGRAVHATTPSPPAPPRRTSITSVKQEKPQESDEDCEFRCPACSESFLCRYGLEAHLQTHPDFTFPCHLCSSTFSTRQELIRHKFEDHKCSIPARMLPEKAPAAASASAYEDSEEQPVGFHELDFVDFTCEKFPLVAQAWCEGDSGDPAGAGRRQASSVLHDFTCGLCGRAFPCRAALAIHANVHTPDNMNECSACGVRLPDAHTHATHMLTHVGRKVVARVSRSEQNQDKPQGMVAKEEFMAAFDLMVKASDDNNKKQQQQRSGDQVTSKGVDLADVNGEAVERGGMEVNVEYYPLLQRMANLQQQQRLERRQYHQNGLPPSQNATNEDGGFEERRDGERHPSYHQQRSSLSKMETASSMVSSGNSKGGGPLDAGNDLADIQQILSHFGSGGSLVQIGHPGAGRPAMGHEAVGGGSGRTFKPLVMTEQHRPSSPAETSMKLPVTVTNGFVPISSRKSEVPETHTCKYCPEVFTTYKAYKSHVRTHLGLSPYKCSQCPYSSADKSTLIRHLRTHNGERPYQCQICTFAFTTKANCERHVRKKHMRFSKKDIEEAIGYNHYGESASDGAVDSFASPDTVCKYCGEDFRFFRALKHHLRSHSSCTQKPFSCTVCQSGFSTKVNCLRHIQKAHPEVEQRMLEEHVLVNELLAAAVSEDLKVYESIEAMNRSTTSSPALPYSSHHHLAGLMDASFGTASPIVISPIPDNLTPQLHNGTFITSPPILNLQQEARSTDDDEAQPLDFSMKATSSSGTPARAGDNMDSDVKIEQAHMSGGQAILCGATSAERDDDEPMDLTCKPPGSSDTSGANTPTRSSSYDDLSKAERPRPARSLSDLPPSVAARALPQLLASPNTPDYGMLRYKKEYQKFYNPTVGRLQCPYCKMLFKHGLKLQVHIRSHTNERPFSCPYCSASFTIKTNLERHLKTRHPNQPAILPEHGSEGVAPPSATAGDDRDSVSDVGEPPVQATSTPVPLRTRSPKTNVGGSDDSSCELSSVTKILDVTNPNHFRSFFSAAEDATPVPMTSSTPHCVPAVTPFATYRDQLVADDAASNQSGQSLAARGEDDLTHPIDYDEDEESDDVDMEISVLKTGPRLPQSQRHLTPEDIVKQSTENLPIIKIRNPKSAERAEDGSGSPVRKKRNSYADSPHKLMCPYCPRAFPWISSLNRHILTHTGQKPFKCPQCPVMFSTKSNRERHLVRKHGLNVLDPATRQMMDRPFKCHLCVFSSFSTAGNLVKHYSEKHQEEPIPEHLLAESDANNNTDTYTTECRENSEAAEASKAKRLEFGDEDEDSKDGLSDGIQDGLGQKLMEHVQPSLTPSNSRPSTPAGGPCSPAAAPGTPERSTTHATNPERDNYNVDKITYCWKCDEEFGSRKGLLRHLKEHNIDLAFKCYLCDASFDERLESLEHLQSRHAADWATLSEKNQLGEADEFADCMNRIVEQNFMSGGGGSGAGTAGAGAGQSEKHPMEAELAKYKVQLTEDMLRPESDYAQRKVYCSLCPKRFWSLQDLRRHMRSHTGERPFECDICQKRFTLKHSMMRHRRKHRDAGVACLSASDDESTYTTEQVDDAAQMAAWTENKKLSSAALLRQKEAGGISGRFSDMSSDLLHNLLGIEDSQIDDMLTCSADNAARVLGVEQQ